MQQNDAVEMELDLFFKMKNGPYLRKSDRVRELTMPQEEFCRFLKAAGLEVVEVYDYLTFDKPKKDSEKLVFVAKKH